MVLEAYLANKVSGLSDKELEEIKEAFKRKFDLIEFDKEQINSINELLIHDKKFSWEYKFYFNQINRKICN